jgi:hypothetical protein
MPEIVAVESLDNQEQQPVDKRSSVRVGRMAAARAQSSTMRATGHDNPIRATWMLVTRRLTLLTGAAFAASLAACAPAQQCTNLSGPGFSLCREDEIAHPAPKDITAEVLIGAALGAPFATDLQGNAAVTAVGGAMLAGGTPAAAQYWNYRLGQAQGDQDTALKEAYRDIQRDLIRANDQADNARQNAALLALALGGQGVTPSQKADLIDKGRKVTDITGKNGDAAARAAQVYLLLPDVAHQPLPSSVKTKISQIDQAAQQIKSDQSRMMGMVTPPSHSGTQHP